MRPGRRGVPFTLAAAAPAVNLLALGPSPMSAQAVGAEERAEKRAEEGLEEAYNDWGGRFFIWGGGGGGLSYDDLTPFFLIETPR